MESSSFGLCGIREYPLRELRDFSSPAYWKARGVFLNTPSCRWGIVQTQPKRESEIVSNIAWESGVRLAGSESSPSFRMGVF